MKTITVSLFLLAALTSVEAGTPDVPPLPPPPPDNPLSFFDGRLVLSFEDQLRFESRENNFDFNSGSDALTDDAWLLNRARIGLQWKPLPGVSLFIQGQDSREYFSDRPDIPGVLGSEGDDPFDLHQAWIEYHDAKMSGWGLRVGRQKLSYGDQRLIGPLEWSNFARAFDGIKLFHDNGSGTWFDLFAASPVLVDMDGFNTADFDTMLYGLYGHIPAGRTDLEPYLIYLDDDQTDQHFISAGMHFKSRAGTGTPWDWEGEAVYQSGDIGGADLSAFAGFVRAGYTWADSAWKPRVGIEYSYASGDDDPKDGDINTFQNLYPTNHPLYGFMDAFSWQNMHDVRLMLSANPLKKLRVSADFHLFWLATTNDAWRRANAKTMVRPITPGASSFAGSEVDLLANYTLNPHATFTAGYSHFFAGSYLDDTGAGDDADFFYVISQIKF